MTNVLDATRDTFYDIAGKEGWLLVDIWGPRCAPCLALAPHIENIAAMHQELTVVKLEAPKARRICIDLKVMGLPTLLLYRDGEEVSRISDPSLSAAKVDDWLKGKFIA